MANAEIRINELPVLSVMTDTSVIPVVNSNVTQQISGSTLKSYFSNVANLSVTGNISTGGIKTNNYYYANGDPVNFQQVAGENTSVQFNDSGSLAGTETFTYDKNTDTLTVGNITANLTGQVRFPFSFGDASPRVCANVPANNVVTLATLVYTDPFNDPNATVTIGTSSNVGQILDITDTNPGIVGTYSVEPGHKYNIATEIILTISRGNSTSGGGVLILNYQ